MINLGRLAAGVLLLAFAGVGVAHLLHPDRFIVRSFELAHDFKQ